MTWMTAPPNEADDRLARTAAAFARLAPEQAETAIAAHVADAIRAWQLDEATFWQRVKFKARLLRAAHRNTAPRGEHAC